LLTKLGIARRRATVFPKGFQRYDEAVEAADEEEIIDLDEQVHVVCFDPGDPATDAVEPVPALVDDDYEALDQRRQSSLAQLRACLRSCEVLIAHSLPAVRVLQQAAVAGGDSQAGPSRSRSRLPGGKSG